MIGAVLLAVVLAGPAEDARIHQQDVVEQAAAAVATARAEGARGRDVADLMAVYRQEAEVLARMEPSVAVHVPADARAAAVAALADATANGRADAASRQVVADWLGPLPARLLLLGGALQATAATAARAPELAHAMALDVEAQCTAVMVAAAHDATAATATARSYRLRAAVLRQGDTPLQSGSIDEEVDARAADVAAAQAEALATSLWELRAQASRLREQARHMLGIQGVP